MSASSCSVGGRLVTTLRGRRRDAAEVAGLHQVAAGHRAQGHAEVCAGSGRPPAISRRRFFLAAKAARAVGVGLGRDHHFGEELGDLGRGLAVERPVEGDDAAEGADRIAGQGLAVGV